MASVIAELAGRLIAQEAALGVIRGMIAKAMTERTGRTLVEEMADIMALEQTVLAEYLAELEDKDPALAALLDIRHPGEVAAGLGPDNPPDSAA